MADSADWEHTVHGALGVATEMLVTRWVVVAEAIDDAGERCLHTMTPKGQATWDTLGMLRHEVVAVEDRIEGYSRD